MPVVTTRRATEQRTTCALCGRERTTYEVGTEAYPRRECGTCISRQERRTNTRERYGRGRRGY